LRRADSPGDEVAVNGGRHLAATPGLALFMILVAEPLIARVTRIMKIEYPNGS